MRFIGFMLLFLGLFLMLGSYIGPLRVHYSQVAYDKAVTETRQAGGDVSAIEVPDLSPNAFEDFFRIVSCGPQLAWLGAILLGCGAIGGRIARAIARHSMASHM
jgi:hypothetical protein